MWVLWAFFLLNLWPKFSYIPNGKSYFFFPIFAQKFPTQKIRKNVVTPKILGGLKQGKLLNKWECKCNSKKRSLGTGSEDNELTFSCLFYSNLNVEQRTIFRRMTIVPHLFLISCNFCIFHRNKIISFMPMKSKFVFTKQIKEMAKICLNTFKIIVAKYGEIWFPWRNMVLCS